jgi:hypothetical protein
MGCAVIILGIRPAFSLRDAAWVLLLVAGLCPTMAGLAGWPEVAGIDLSGVAFVGGMAAVLADCFLVAKGTT